MAAADAPAASTMNPVDPQDYRPWPTVRRLLPLWWDERGYAILALACALVYTTFSLIIPILIQRAIDNAMVPHKIDNLRVYVAAIMVFAVLRPGSTSPAATRRRGSASASKRDCASCSTQGYLRFPRAFYDRHPTGQVVSRATNDLFPVRYFIGWGVVQGVQSVMMIVGGAIVLATVNLRLMLYTSVATPLIAFVAWRFAHLVMPISRQVQARKGDVTEAADEAVVGIEMVQAFGREDDVRDRFGGKARAFATSWCARPASSRSTCRHSSSCPRLSIAAVVFFGGRDVIDGELTIGQFVLFNTILLQLAWPLEALGWILNLAQRAIASAGRTFAWLEGVSRLPEPEHPSALPEGELDVRFEDVHFAYSGEEEVLRGVDLDVAAGPDRRRLRADRLRQEHAAEPGGAHLRPDRGPGR